MANPDQPEPPPPTVLFETKPTITGYKLRGIAYQSPGGGISVALFRRVLLGPADSGGEHRQTWNTVSELVVYPPIAIAEVLRTYVSWLNSYDTNLKDELGPLQDALTKLAESAPSPNVPQGPHLN